MRLLGCFQPFCYYRQRYVDYPCAYLGIPLQVYPSGEFLEVELPGQRECDGGWFTDIAQLPSENIATTPPPPQGVL